MTGMPVSHCFQDEFATAADDNGIAFLQKPLGQSQPGTAAATGDQDFVVG